MNHQTKSHSRLPAVVLLGFILMICSPSVAAITLATSTFDSGSDGWMPWTTSTVASPTPGNPYLNIAADGSGEKGRLLTFNRSSSWVGDYLGSGVTHVELDVANMSIVDDLQLRVAIGNRSSPMVADGTWWVSNAAITRTTDTPWIRVSLSLLEADLHKVGNEMGQLGTDTYEQTFADIRAIRIMSSNVGTAAIGDEFFGPVGIDNVSLMAVPEPRSALLFGAAFGLALTRRRR
jgi:hypothetical protein